jgi:hypothetical protein
MEVSPTKQGNHSKLSITSLTHGDMCDAQPDFEYAFDPTHRKSVDGNIKEFKKQIKEGDDKVYDVKVPTTISPACKLKPTCCVCERGIPKSYNTPPTW